MPKVKKRMTNKPEKGEYHSLDLIDLDRKIIELQEQLCSLMLQRDALLEQNRSDTPPSYFM
jgi:hypothetical protein